MYKQIGGSTATSDLHHYQPVGYSYVEYDRYSLICDHAVDIVAMVQLERGALSTFDRLRVAVEAYILACENVRLGLPRSPACSDELQRVILEDLYAIFKTLRYTIGGENEDH